MYRPNLCGTAALGFGSWGTFPLEAVAKAGLAATNVHPFENRIEMAGQL